MKKTQKLKSIIAVRGIAVLLVMFCHFFSETALDVKSARLNIATDTLGHMGVTLFFIVSGFVLPYSMYKTDYSFDRFPRYLYRRAVRIEPPYVASILLVLIGMSLKVLIGQTVNYSGGAIGVITQLLYLNGLLGIPWLNVVYWTLALEFQFYLLIGVIFPFLKRFDFLQLSFGLLLLCSFKFLGMEFKWISYFLPFFVAGYAFCAFKLEKITLGQLISLIIICALFNLYRNDVLYSIMDIITVIVFAVLFCLEKRGMFPRWLLFVGEISYSIYLVHNIIVFGICVLNPLHLGLKIRIVICFLALIIAIWPSYLFYKYVEKPFHLNAQKMKR